MLRRRKRPAIDMGFQLQCPCCYRPGNPFCDSCVPEDNAKRLAGLRALMAAHGVDAYIVGSQDAHSSEYIGAADERRTFLTGFGGSAGTAIVTPSEALLWTDSRYFLEAEERLRGTEWVLMRMFEPGVPQLHEWVLRNLGGKTVGVDPALVPSETGEDWRARWGPKVTVKGIRENLVDAIWATQPEEACGPIQVHPLEHSGESVADKLGRVRAAIAEEGAEVLVLSALDQIAWLFNLRGSDIPFNPVFLSYAVVADCSAVLFVRALDDGREGLDPAILGHLADAGVTARPYRSFLSDAPSMLAGKKVFVERSTCSMAIMDLIPPDLRVTGVSPVEKFKAVKNAQEIEGLRRACLRDSAALCEFFAWLETQLAEPRATPLTEVGAAEALSELRLKQPLCVGDSFQTISSAGSNSAIVHYHAEKGKCKDVDPGSIYLVDTGGQYRDGTTDVTRTVHFGEPSAEQRRCYTRVLQGHIALASAVFPEGTPGIMLDTFARAPLWRDGLSYGHGTGHGIGAYLNVHEGPFGIGGGSVPGPAISNSERMKRVYLSPLEAGHYVSNEPGYYMAGEFGIRLESDLVVVPAETPFASGSRPWLRFEYLTLVPFCGALLDTSLLTREDAHWLDAYHGRVRAALEGSLSGAAREWLLRATRPLAGAE